MSGNSFSSKVWYKKLDISLTEKGLVYIYNKRIQGKVKQPDESNVAISLTDKEKEWMRRKIEA